MKPSCNPCKWLLIVWMGGALAACTSSPYYSTSPRQQTAQRSAAQTPQTRPQARVPTSSPGQARPQPQAQAQAQAQSKPQSQSQSQGQPQSQLPVPVLNTHQLMERFNKPTFQSLKDLMAQPPSNEKAWEAIQEHAADLAELANLVAIREVKKSEQWRKYAAQVQQNALQLAEQAYGQKWEGTRKAYEQTVQSCNSCHSEFEPMHAPELEP